MNISVRLLQETDLRAADRVFRLAFGTFQGLPDPLTFGGDTDCIRTRWLADPSAAFGAEIDAELAGSVLATHWGSVAFFGPLTVRPDLWDQGIARRLLEPVMELFTRWGARHTGLYTYAQSPKHVGLYQKFGFWPRFLTALMEKPVRRPGPGPSGSSYSTPTPTLSHRGEGVFKRSPPLPQWRTGTLKKSFPSATAVAKGNAKRMTPPPRVGEDQGEGEKVLPEPSTYSEVPEDGRANCLRACRELTDAVYEGLCLEREIRAADSQKLGDTVLLWEDARLVGLAVCHCGPGSEAGGDTCYVKFGAARPGPTAAEAFRRLLDACEALAAQRGMSRLVAGVSTARHEAYREMMAHGFRTFMQGVAMHRPNEPGYHRSGVYVMDDWR